MTDARIVLITGCSSGIGNHAARTLAARGWRVLATCRKQADCDRLEAEGLESFRIDYEDPASIEAGFAEAMARGSGRLDALFNNGAYAVPGAAEDLPVEALRAIFEANFFGWHDLTRRALAVMRRQGHGRVLMNSSVLGLAGARMRAAYVATKFAVEGYTDTLRLELRGTGIHPILLEPGPVKTMIRVNSQAHYERWIDKRNSAWRDFYDSTLEPRLYKSPKKDAFELSCAATSKKVVAALESRRPRARYYVTTPTHVVGTLKRLLPSRWLDSVMMKA